MFCYITQLCPITTDPCGGGLEYLHRSPGDVSGAKCEPSAWGYK
jgi:hypothetical protein